MNLLDQYGLQKCRNQKADTLSGGERFYKLEISRAAGYRPEIDTLG